jgi:phosphoadenosine phosphosulfate reductase
MFLQTDLIQLQSEVNSLTAEQALQWVYSKFDVTEIVLASSLGAEDQVLTHLILQENKAARIFTLDTGRQFQENYDVMDESTEKYNFSYEICFPEAEAVRELMASKGANSFYKGIPERKECCKIRKIDPLREKLKTAKIWITGLRAEQSITRTETPLLEWDSAFNLFKLNPLTHWTEEQVWEFINQHLVPYNKLHDKNYPSIGCAPCTRAVQPGEDVRAGRWWWEQPEHKECGLHWVDGKLVPKKAK